MGKNTTHRDRILNKWEGIKGIDIAYVKCLLQWADGIQSCEEAEKKVRKFDRQKFQDIRKLLKKLEEIETWWRAQLVKHSSTKLLKLMHDREFSNWPEGSIGYSIGRLICDVRFRLSLSSLSHKERGRPAKNNIENIPESIASSINRPLIDIYDHLVEVVGKKSYGREKALPKQFQKDLYSLFHEIAPDAFLNEDESSSTDSLSKRISWLKSKKKKGQ